MKPEIDGLNYDPKIYLIIQAASGKLKVSNSDTLPLGTDQTMQSQHFSRAFKDLVKQQMKKKKFTYQDLATHLICSVPTVKRILGPEEISLSRVLEIASWLNLTLGEIEKLIHHELTLQRENFTLEQEEFLAKESHFLGYLGLLYSQYSPDQIAEKFNLTERSTSLYLLRLERLGLLKLDSKNRVRLAHRQYPGFNKDGALIRTQKNQMIDRISNFFKRKLSAALGGDKNSPTHMTIASYSMSQLNYDKWHSQLDALFLNIQSEALFEEKVIDVSKSPVGVFSLMHTIMKPEDPEIKGLEETFGTIKNL